MPRDRGIARCRQCFWNACISDTVIVCDYLEKAGHRRPCPPGWDCTEFRPRKPRPPQPWHDQAMELYNQGYLDGVIAAGCGVKTEAIAHWRMVNGLRSNYSRRLGWKDIEGDLETKCLKLYFDGCVDDEIAAQCGADISTESIRRWRQHNQMYLRPQRRKEALHRLMREGKWPR